MKLKMLTRMAAMVAAGSLVVGLLAGCSVIPSKDGAADSAVPPIPPSSLRRATVCLR